MPANSSALGVLSLVFLAGAVLFALGSWFARRPQAGTVAATQEKPTWTRDVTGNDDDLSSELRLDLIERLAIVGAPWCVAALEMARKEERDPALCDAAERALLVIGCRPDSF